MQLLPAKPWRRAGHRREVALKMFGADRVHADDDRLAQPGGARTQESGQVLPRFRFAAGRHRIL